MSKSSYVTIALGSVKIPRDQWEVARKHGYTRSDLREMIVDNGESAMSDMLSDIEECEHGERVLYCKTCILKDLRDM